MTRYLLSTVLISSILFGLLLPSLATLWVGYITPMLALLTFFSMLEIDPGQLLNARMRELLLLLFSVLVIPPIISLPFKAYGTLVFVGVLAALASPSGSLIPFLTSFLGGDVALGVSISFISSLLSLATFPLTMQILAGSSVPVDQSKIFTILIEVILIPVVLGMVVKKFFAGIALEIKRRKDYQLLFLFLIASAILGTGRETLVGREYLFAELVASLLGAILLLGAVAYLLGKKYGASTATTFFVATVYKNNTLSFAIILALLGVNAALSVVACSVVQYLLVIAFEIFGESSKRP